MIESGPVSEAEMVLEFLKAEADSPRFRPVYRGLDRALIERPDLASEDENARRKQALADARGYGMNRHAFGGFPDDVTWRRAQLDLRELGLLKYSNWPGWMEASGGTRFVVSCSQLLKANPISTDLKREVLAIVRLARQGRVLPDLIAVDDQQGALVLVEGHKRATAYVFDAVPKARVIIGTSPSMRSWKTV